MLFQTCMSFFHMLNTKEEILKNGGNQAVDGPHYVSQQLFGSSKLFKISSIVL